MQKKTMAMIMMVGCSAMLLTGCGVSEEEHNKVLKQVADRDKEIATMKDAVEQSKEAVATEQAKARKLEADVSVLNDELNKIKGAVAAETEKYSAEQQKVSALESELSTSKSDVARVQATLTESEVALKELSGKYQNMLKRWEQFEKNLQNLDKELGGNTVVKGVAETVKAPEAVKATAEGDNLLDGIK